MAETPAVDLVAVRASVEKLTDAELKERLLSVRVRQKVQIAKGAANSKKYAARQREREKMIKQLAIERGLFDSVEAEAVVKAEAKIDELGIGGTEEDEAATA